MNRLVMRLLAAAAAAAGCVPAGLLAQNARTEFNFGAGATVPAGDVSSRLPAGYNLNLGLGLTPTGSSLGLRVEGLYNAFGARQNYAVSCQSGTSCSRQSYVTGATFNLVYQGLLPYNGRPGERHRGSTSTLYVIGGFGFYNMHAPVAGGGTPGGFFAYENTTQAYTGWNLGGGLRFPVGTASLYVEARVHSLNPSGTRFVPITVGFVF